MLFFDQLVIAYKKIDPGFPDGNILILDNAPINRAGEVKVSELLKSVQDFLNKLDIRTMYLSPYSWSLDREIVCLSKMFKLTMTAVSHPHSENLYLLKDK